MRSWCTFIFKTVRYLVKDVILDKYFRLINVTVAGQRCKDGKREKITWGLANKCCQQATQLLLSIINAWGLWFKVCNKLGEMFPWIQIEFILHSYFFVLKKRIRIHFSTTSFWLWPLPLLWLVNPGFENTLNKIQHTISVYSC